MGACNARPCWSRPRRDRRCFNARRRRKLVSPHREQPAGNATELSHLGNAARSERSMKKSRNGTSPLALLTDRLPVRGRIGTVLMVADLAMRQLERSSDIRVARAAFDLCRRWYDGEAGRVIVDPQVPHPSYDTQLGGLGYTGGLDRMIPREVTFPDFYAGRRAAGARADRDHRAFKQGAPHQVADQKWLDGVMKYREEQNER
jgi:hypothetical protein